MILSERPPENRYACAEGTPHDATEADVDWEACLRRAQAYIRRLGLSREDGEDLASEALLVLLESISRRPLDSPTKAVAGAEIVPLRLLSVLGRLSMETRRARRRIYRAERGFAELHSTVDVDRAVALQRRDHLLAILRSIPFSEHEKNALVWAILGRPHRDAPQREALLRRSLSSAVVRIRSTIRARDDTLP